MVRATWIQIEADLGGKISKALLVFVAIVIHAALIFCVYLSYKFIKIQANMDDQYKLDHFGDVDSVAYIPLNLDYAIGENNSLKHWVFS